MSDDLLSSEQDEVASVVTATSWLIVDEDDERERDLETMVVVASDGEEQEVAACTEEANPIAAAMEAVAAMGGDDTDGDASVPGSAFESVATSAKEEEPEAVEEKPVVDEKASASLWYAHPLEMCSDATELFECPGHQGEVTCQWWEAIKNFDVKSAVCLGRLGIAQGANGAFPALARIVVRNDGPCAWPEASTLRLVAGAGWGFHELYIGALGAGQCAELVLDVCVPSDLAAYPGAGQRSGWVLEDGTGRPFGPLLVLEVVCA